MTRSASQYRFEVKLTREEFKKVMEQYNAGAERIVVATVILGRGGYSRPCPGRLIKGVGHRPCIGNGSMPLELRNMGRPGKPSCTVRDQPECRACR